MPEKKSKRIDWFLTSHKHINQQCACLIAASTCQPAGKIRQKYSHTHMYTHTHTNVEPCTHVLCDRKFWQALITANCQVWPVVGHALLHRPANSIYFKFDCYKKILSKKYCKLFTKSKTDFGNKFVMHVTCSKSRQHTHTQSHTGSTLLYFECVCVSVCVCAWTPKRNLNKWI